MHDSPRNPWAVPAAIAATVVALLASLVALAATQADGSTVRDGELRSPSVNRGLPSLARSFTSTSPTRLVDTRQGLGLLSPLGWNDTETFAAGSVPPGATVVLNVTAVEPTNRSFLSVWPSGSAWPGTSNLNMRPGQVVANLVVTSVGPDGRIAIYNQSGSTNVVVDLFGWLPAGDFTRVGPSRVVDTRLGLGVAGSVGQGQTVSFTPTGVPVGAVAVLNVTADAPTAGSFLTVWPSGSPWPGTSNLNLNPGETVANLAVSRVGPDGRVAVYNNTGSTELVVDVFGWLPASAFTPVGPTRLVDSRSGTGVSGSLDAAETATFRVPGVPAGGVAVLNVAVTEPTLASYLSVWESGTPWPGTSNLNYGPGQTVANLALARVGADGRVAVYNNSGSAHVVVDMLGWLPAVAGAWTPPPPVSESTFLETFTGAPASPATFTSPRWDVRHNITDYQKWGIGQSMDAQHGADCSAPPATHHVHDWMTEGTFVCRDHLMTSVNADSYGLTMLTPAAQVDFSSGGTVAFDVSTLMMSGRDWIDLWVTPAADFLTLACGGKCPAYNGSPRNTVHVEKDGPRWTISVIRNFQTVGYGEFFEVNPPSATVRTPFELRLSPSGVQFGTPADGRFTTVSASPGFTRGFVQWGHHSYNPFKDSAGTAATWHWDNFRIQPAVPMSLVKATSEREIGRVGDVRTVTLTGPAPANAILVFNAVCRVDVNFGAGFQPAPEVPGSTPRGPETGHSYTLPIAQGTSSFQIRFQAHDWYAGYPCLFEAPAVFGRS